MKHTVKYLMIFFTALTGCVTTSLEQNNIPDYIGGNPNTMILNYENRAVTLEEPIADSHMRIYLEIEKPYIISIPAPDAMDKIYSVAGIEGTTVYRLEIDEQGTILNSKKTLSAGLGMDEIADDILKQIKVEPAFLAGKPGNCSADLKIIFKADKAE